MISYCVVIEDEATALIALADWSVMTGVCLVDLLILQGQNMAASRIVAGHRLVHTLLSVSKEVGQSDCLRAAVLEELTFHLQVQNDLLQRQDAF